MLEYIGAAKSLLDAFVTVKEKLIPGPRADLSARQLAGPIHEALTPMVAAYILAIEKTAQELDGVNSELSYHNALNQVRLLRLENLAQRIDFVARASGLGKSTDEEELRLYFELVGRTFDAPFLGSEDGPSITNMILNYLEAGEPSKRTARALAQLSRDLRGMLEAHWRQVTEAFHKLPAEPTRAKS